MLKVAITGNIASGKSVTEKFLKSKNFSVLDTDEVTHDLLKDEFVKKEIKVMFPNYDIFDDGEISRPKLGKIVFDNENLRKKLESVLHPKIKSKIKDFFQNLENEGAKIAFVSVPLLFEAKFEALFDKIILIYSNDNLRLERLINRNNLSVEHAQNRLKIQISQDDKKSLADYVIYNNESINDLHKNTENILKLL